MQIDLGFNKKFQLSIDGLIFQGAMVDRQIRHGCKGTF